MSGFASPRFVLPRASATVRPLSAAAVAAAYNFPSADTTGQKIAYIELGGAHSAADFADYCGRVGMHMVPSVIVHEIGGASQTPDPGGADVEVALDVQVGATVAPHAEHHLIFAPNTPDGFALAVVYAISIGAVVVGISWGARTSSWAKAELDAMEQAFAQAKASNVVITVAAGDAGKNDGTRKAVADYPASSPQVIACGGTELVLAAGKRASETVWDDGASSATGGGVSAVFARPPWQPASVGTMRGLPDVTGNAAPESGYAIVSGGELITVGGTSAVAPLYAGLVAVLTTLHNGPLVDFAEWCYANPGVFVDVTSGGGKDTYPPAAGWDEASGLGVMDGAKAAALLGVVLPPTQPPPPVPPPADPTRTRTPQEQAAAGWMGPAIVWMSSWLASLPPA